MGKLFSKTYQTMQQKLTLSEFYGMKDSRNALYQSKISNKSAKQKVLIKKVIPYSDQDQQISSYLAKLQYLGQHIQGQNLHLPVYCQVQQTNQFCSDYKNLIIYYEDYDVKVKDQIIARKREFQHFSQQEIWYILYSIINALRKFQRFGLKSGKLTTSRILLNQKGHLKLVNQLTSPDLLEYDFFGSTMQGIQNFNSPQQLQKERQIKQSRGSRHTKVHPNISQTFSLGIIILQVCTFIQSESFYDLKNKKMNDKILEKGFYMLQKIGYSKLLQNLVRVMLSNQNDRPLPSQVYSVFKPYEKYILNLQRFQFTANNLYNSLYPSQIRI